MKKPDFQKHRQYKSGYKMLIRFVIYSLIIGFLIYLIDRKEASTNQIDNKEINHFLLEEPTQNND